MKAERRYAFVDVETSGFSPERDDLLEICVLREEEDGETREFHSLVRSYRSVPGFIGALTGITTHDVSRAPDIAEIANKLQILLDSRVVVAHNAQFDAVFIETALQRCGVQMRVKRICTMKLARAILPGLNSYSLQSVARQLLILPPALHRARVDALTCKAVFYALKGKCTPAVFEELIKKQLRAQASLSNLNDETIQNLPSEPGVYYFLNARREPLYIGKAKCVKKRIRSHFSSPGGVARNMHFQRHVSDIQVRETGSELLAALLEDSEIRKHFPPFNRAQKERVTTFTVMPFRDGFLRWHLAVTRANIQSRIRFLTKEHAVQWVFDLASTKGWLAPDAHPSTNLELAAELNLRDIENSVTTKWQQLQDFAVVCSGRSEQEMGFALIAQGVYAGFGYIPANFRFAASAELVPFLEKVVVSPVAHSVVLAYAQRQPNNVCPLKSAHG